MLDPDTALLLDVDVQDIGQAWERFAFNVAGIDLEYARLPMRDYYQRQIAFFERMPARHSIYRTPHFAEHESVARANILRLVRMRREQLKQTP